uniref:MSP domain-containing protein n=1 Tax=Spongospora subterranea TaxID=70186 RepID=A0A0H5R8L8_9EUKA|eukprot:CRZ10062.1 hypothetical protein [Spongospora subterranea]
MSDDAEQPPESPSGQSTLIKPADPLQVLEVTPSELRIQCLLNVEVSYSFVLKNITKQIVAFKVKTTAPRRYMVRPAQGSIPPAESATITVVLVKITSYPDQTNPRNLRDKFLVQSLVLPCELSTEEQNHLWTDKEKKHDPRGHRAYYEHKLKCRLVIPLPESDGEIGGGGVPTAHSAIGFRGGSVPTATSTMEQSMEPASNPTSMPTPLKTVITAFESVSPTALPLSSPSSSVEVRSPPMLTSADVAEPTSSIVSESTSQKTHATDVVAPSVETNISSGVTKSESPTVASAPETVPSSSQKKAPSTLGQEFATMVNRPKEYDKMLAYSVKLTAEREALELKIARLTQVNTSLMEENDDLRKSLALSGTPTPSTTLRKDTSPKSVIDALHENGIQFSSVNPFTDLPVAGMPSDAASQLALGSGIQVWQILAIAALCYLLGRIL